jgi:Tol biopolymer transport system component
MLSGGTSRKAIVAHARIVVLAVVALAAAACAGSDKETSADGTVVFAVFKLPGNTGCGGGIWAVDAPDSQPRLIVRRTDHERLGKLNPNYPRFTPDGRSLLLAHFRASQDLPELDVYRMAIRSGRVRPVFAGAIAFLYRWTEDAPALVTARGDELVAVDAASGRVKELGRGEGPDYALDPPGRRLAYSRREGQGRSLWVRPVAGGHARRVALDGQWPFWSRDGSRLAFFAGDAISESTAPPRVVPASGGEVRQLVPDALTGRVLWAGNEVLLLRTPNEDAVGTEYGVGDLHGLEVEGGDTRAIAEEVLPLEVSADGRRLLFLRPAPRPRRDQLHRPGPWKSTAAASASWASSTRRT